MYLDYFGLDEAPFSITPDPTFIYLSQRHRDALAHLLYGVGQGGSGGFVQLTGEVGTGKTTLCRALLEKVPPGTHIALVLNPLMGPVEMLAAICEELRIPTAGIEDSPKVLVDRLNDFLLEAHRRGERVVLVIDEAQNLSIDALEQVRLLTNLETSKDKLLQIILLGQPELRDLLRRRSLRQLAQRITARYHLTPLAREDTARYVSHRLAVAGAGRDPFSRSGHRALFQRAQGVPRLINIIADRALAAAFAREAERVDAALVNAAADEIQLGEPGVGRRAWPRYAAAAAAVAVLGVGVWATAGWLQQRAAPTALAEARDDAAAGTATTASTPDGPSVDSSPQPPAGADAPPETSRAAEASAVRPEADVGADVAGAITAAPFTDPVPDAQDEPTAVEPAPDPAPDLDPAWFEEQDLRAWPGLAAAWGAPEDAALIEASCLGREGLGYACIRDQGTWLRIRQLGLPVVLVLQGAPPGHVLLSGMVDQALLVGAGATQRTVTRAAIEQRWYGDYFVAWPQAPDWPREIGPGDSGEAVERVLELATRADVPYAGAREFGSEFEAWLTAFQVRNGLDPDGIVGPKTLLYLMRQSIEEPRLLTALDRRGG